MNEHLSLKKECDEIESEIESELEDVKSVIEVKQHNINYRRGTYYISVKGPKKRKNNVMLNRVVNFYNKQANGHAEFIKTENHSQANYTLNYKPGRRNSSVNRIGQYSLKVSLHETGHWLKLNHCYGWRRKWRGRLLHDQRTIMSGDASGRTRLLGSHLYRLGWLGDNYQVATHKEQIATITKLDDRYNNQSITNSYAFVIPYELWQAQDKQNPNAKNKPSAVLCWEVSGPNAPLSLNALYDGGNRFVKRIKDQFHYERFNIKITIIKVQDNQVVFKIECLNK